MSSTQDIEDAKSYMARKQVYQLFESLLTGLVHNRPEDPVDFLEQCLQRVKQNRDVKWDSFLQLDEDKRDISAQTVADTIINFEKIFNTEPDAKQ